MGKRGKGASLRMVSQGGWGSKCIALWCGWEGWRGGDPQVSLPSLLAGSSGHVPFTCISKATFSCCSSFLEIVSFRRQR